MLIWRVFRRLLAQVIHLLLLNRLVTLGLVAVLVVGFVVVPLLSGSGALGGDLNQAGMLATGQPAQAAGAPTAAGQSATASENLPPDPAVQTYLKGMLAFDADTMWTSLHPQFRSQLQQSGVTVDSMKAQEAKMASSGVKYDNVYYIGAFQGPSGFKYFFYIVTFSGTDSSGQHVSNEYAYTFGVAPDGGGIYNISQQ